MTTAIWWIRRDLRLKDNQALSLAIKSADQVVPVFIFDPKLLKSDYSSPVRVAFMMEGLWLLGERLKTIGSTLILRCGDPTEMLRQLLSEVHADTIFAEEDFSPYSRQRDNCVAIMLPLHLVGGLTLLPPSAVVKPDRSPYTVFTPFSRKWRDLAIHQGSLPAPSFIHTPIGIPSEPILEYIPPNPLFPAGEEEAARRLDAFVETKIDAYANDRDRMDLVGTSGLSPYLRFGMLSARQAAGATQRVAVTHGKTNQFGSETWLNEIIWREFYISILYHFPHARQMAFRSQMRDIRWINDPQDFTAWKEGLTGYPVVDAAMRQLKQTGWMHNRARMITASFLTKDLLIDWRWGEKYFMQQLIDGDPAANNGGWQWSAGTGSDAAPYFRVFNPVLQGEKFDPLGDYVRRWVPELSILPGKFIHQPWSLPLELVRKLDFKLGSSYPRPIIDHAFARQRVLAVYKKATTPPTNRMD